MTLFPLEKHPVFGHYKFETKEDIYEYWSTTEYEVAWECWNEFKSGAPVQTWGTMPSKEFVQMVRKAAGGWLTYDDKMKIAEWQLLVFYNFLKLCFNTKMVGHDQSYPKDVAEEYELDNVSEWTLEAYCDWVEDDAFSDYGLKPIGSIVISLFLTKDYSEKMKLIADIIGVIHQRGDLCRFFVQYGRKTRSQIESNTIYHGC